MKPKITYTKKKHTLNNQTISGTLENIFPLENFPLNSDISVKNNAPRRTYSHKPIPSRILSDKSNTTHIPDTYQTKSLYRNNQKAQNVEGRLEIHTTNHPVKEFIQEKTLPKVAIPISKLRKKQTLPPNALPSIDTNKKRNLSTTSYLIDSIRTKENPHIDINDLPPNILDDLSSFQQLSSDGLPVATSTPKETILTTQHDKPLLDVSQNVSLEVSPLALPTSTCAELDKKMPSLALLSLNTKKTVKKTVKAPVKVPVKGSVKGPLKELTKEPEKEPAKSTNNRFKKNGMLVKRLPQPITCDSSLDDEIITAFP
ncbi:hypothetical protein PCANB_000299 [Pneumocystis canis]|nr:hypothetical protein PCK1_000429 [Pneumocystis canis]KAG5437953.1 hypothetical protein PCANB_000299 [Pneumocystis canis]